MGQNGPQSFIYVLTLDSCGLQFKKERWDLIYSLYFCFDIFFLELLAVMMNLFYQNGGGDRKVKLGFLDTLNMVSLISANKEALMIVNTCACPDITHIQTQKLWISIFVNAIELFLW